MKLIEYITGSRRGREANRLEREAMGDPFLADAMQGYDSVEADHAGRVERLMREVELRSRKSSKIAMRRRIIAGWSAAAVLLAGASATLLYIYSPWIGGDGDFNDMAPALALAVPGAGEETAEDTGGNQSLEFSCLPEARMAAGADRFSEGSSEKGARIGQPNISVGRPNAKSVELPDRFAGGVAEQSPMTDQRHAGAAGAEVREESEDCGNVCVSVDMATVDSRTLAVVSASSRDSVTVHAAASFSSSADVDVAVSGAVPASVAVSRRHSGAVATVEKEVESNGGDGVSVQFRAAESFRADPVADSAAVAVVSVCDSFDVSVTREKIESFVSENVFITCGDADSLRTDLVAARSAVSDSSTAEAASVCDSLGGLAVASEKKPTAASRSVPVADEAKIFAGDSSTVPLSSSADASSSKSVAALAYVSDLVGVTTCVSVAGEGEGEGEALSGYAACTEDSAQGETDVTVGTATDSLYSGVPDRSVVCKPAASVIIADSVAAAEAAGNEISAIRVSESEAGDVHEPDLKVEAAQKIGKVKKRKSSRPVSNKDVTDALSGRIVSMAIPDSVVVVYDYPGFKGWCESHWKTLLTHRKDLAKGTVVIDFRVDEDRTISDIHIVSGVSPEVNEEAIKIMRAWPLWESSGKRRIRVIMECR